MHSLTALEIVLILLAFAVLAFSLYVRDKFKAERRSPEELPTDWHLNTWVIRKDTLLRKWK